MDDVNCNGNESLLTNCPFSGWSIHNCDHSEDVGVVCGSVITAMPPQLTIRLVNGSDGYSGRLEVNAGGVWGSVCDDGWDIIDANVICEELYGSDALIAYG